MSIKRIHVYPSRIRTNRTVEIGKEEPVFVVRIEDGGTHFGFSLEILGPSRGCYIMRDARAWIETESPVVIDGVRHD